MDSNADSTPIRRIQPNGALETLVVDPTSRDPQDSPALDATGQNTEMAMEELGGRTKPDGIEENTRHDDTELRTTTSPIDSNALDLASQTSTVSTTVVNSSSSTAAVARGPVTRLAKRKVVVDLSGENLPMTNKQRMPKKPRKWKAQRHGSRTKPARRAEAARDSTEQLMPVKKHLLHPWSTVQDVRNFLSNLTCDKTLLIYPIPIAYSSGREKRQLKHLEQSQERVTLTSWTRTPLNGATCRLGVFTTWLDTWVGRIEKFQKEALHVWVAALLTLEMGRYGKCLIIYDSNSDLLKKERITKNDLFLGKQRGLINHLVKEEEYKLSDIWVGGEGNTDQGDCLEVTANWIQEVARAGLDIDKLAEMGFRRVEEA